MPNPIVHFEIPATDVEKIRRFYTEVFGWKMTTDPSMPDYTTVETAEGGMGIDGGIMKRQSPQHTAMNYAMVASVTEFAEKVKQQGGQVVVPKTAIPNMGYFAVCLDPENNPIGLFETDPTAA
jgi:predicted enzyme related to lactoylglutathione lyase